MEVNENGNPSKIFIDKLYFLLGTVFVCFQVYTALFGVIPGVGQKAIHLGLILTLLFLGNMSKSRGIWLTLLNLLLLVMSIVSIAYILFIDKTIDLRAGITLPADIIFGIMLIIVLLEASRKVVGPSLLVIILLFIAYAFLGRYFPIFLAHAGMSLGRFINLIVLSTDGIFGSPLYASAVYIVLFIILGAVFGETGVGDYFTGLATTAFGRFKGGPAKISVIASGLFGSVNGSAIANVVGTGTFTIPLMKKNGFEPEYAGAVEAASSTGGQIMPPIMGTTAFLVAQMLNIPYFDVVKAALVPAILYFGGILMTVDIHARKKDLKSMDISDVPKLSSMLKKSYLFLPLVFLVVILGVFNFTITKAGIYTLIFTIFLSLFSSETRLTKEKLVRIVKNSVSGSIPVAVACAAVGIVIGVVMGTGLGFRLSGILVDLAHGQKMLLLVLTMLVSIILGMGVPTTAAYLVLAVLVAPALIKLQVLPMAAHLFIFYFGIISNITPPVALAAYAAAGIAHCNPNKCGFTAFHLAISGFILPFMFVYNPSLMLYGAWYNILRSLFTALIGVYCLSAAMEGFAVKWKISWIERFLYVAVAFLLIDSGSLTDLLGVGLLVLLIVFRVFLSQKTRPAAVKD